jgi:diguanylate cyclase (GGDEF)-like protein
VWAAYRFGPREVAAAVALVWAFAVWNTVRGAGPFADRPPNDSLLLLQAFLAVASFTGLALAAVMAERRRAERWLRGLATSDPLTGLANYRHLMSVLEAERLRAGRTGRPFAVVLLDLDRLKDINDRHGHLVGSRALCRVAEALRLTCRAIDTAARFGGDEFALVLPETGAVAARRVVRRVLGRLARDRELPPVSASAGVAVYPRDGDTQERLLEAADRALYLSKGRSDAAAAG